MTQIHQLSSNKWTLNGFRHCSFTKQTIYFPRRLEMKTDPDVEIGEDKVKQPFPHNRKDAKTERFIKF